MIESGVSIHDIPENRAGTHFNTIGHSPNPIRNLPHNKFAPLLLY